MISIHWFLYACALRYMIICVDRRDWRDRFCKHIWVNSRRVCQWLFCLCLELSLNLSYRAMVISLAQTSTYPSTIAQMEDVPNRASNSLTYPLLGPLFRRISSYAQLCPNLEHVPQLGLLPSHLSLRFLHITQAMRFGFTTTFSSPFIEL